MQVARRSFWQVFWQALRLFWRLVLLLRLRLRLLELQQLSALARLWATARLFLLALPWLALLWQPVRLC